MEQNKKENFQMVVIYQNTFTQERKIEIRKNHRTS